MPPKPKPPPTDQLILAQVTRIADAMEALLVLLEAQTPGGSPVLQEVRDRFKRLRYTVEPSG